MNEKNNTEEVFQCICGKQFKSKRSLASHKVDAYDKEKNVVLEYDEAKHYYDVNNNILREKDLKRQQEIIDHLHCEFWRYNETTKVLWKVKKSF